MKLVSLPDVASLAERAGEALDALLSRHVGLPRLLLCSGGSALKLLPFVQAHACDETLTVTVLDERVTSDQQSRNFPQVFQSELAALGKPLGVQWFDPVPHEQESPELAAWRFQTFLREWRKAFPAGMVIATMGLGSDGHTAGIFPYPEDPQGFLQTFDHDATWTVGYHAGYEKHVLPDRVTVNLPFLRTQVDAAVAFAVGDDKRPALHRLLAPAGTLPETPARIMLEMPHVILYTDQA